MLPHSLPPRLCLRDRRASTPVCSVAADDRVSGGGPSETGGPWNGASFSPSLQRTLSNRQVFLADAKREASGPTTRAIARSCFHLLHVWALAESCTGGEASAWRPGRCQQEVASATREFVKYRTYLKEKDRRTRALECHRTPSLYHQKKGRRKKKKKKKKGSLQISSSPDRKSPPPVPDLHDPDLPTLARSGQVVCRDPAASSGGSLHKPGHKGPTQRTAFEEHRKKQSVRFAPPTEPGGLRAGHREGKINTAI